MKIVTAKTGVFIIAMIFACSGIAFWVGTTQRTMILKTDSLQISGVVVPHHDIVKLQRADFFKSLKATGIQPKTIILVSPNHFEAGKGTIQTTQEDWNITGGIIKEDSDVTGDLIKNSIASNEPTSFLSEHGIKLILPDLLLTFPAVHIVPIILKRDTSKDEAIKLATFLDKDCTGCLMVSSVDFSHYQPALLANLHDSVSERALAQLDEDTLMTKSEVDSPAALTLLAEWAKLHNTTHFNETLHTNSGELLHNTDGETTTHVFGWYQNGDSVTSAKSVSFSVGGDMMFGRSVAHTYLQPGLATIFSQLGERAFWGTDAGIANLEGPISATPVPDVTDGNDLNFNFPPQTIQALAFEHFSAVSLANNHAANAGVSGLETTYELLKKAGIQAIGGPSNAQVTNVGTFHGNGLMLTVIGVETLQSIPDITNLIQGLKKDPNQRVLIFPHWGEEYSTSHTSAQAAMAHSWIDAGADIIIGSHPHVIEDAEVYKGKPIFYSVGNLVFDQTLSKETQQGLIISGQFSEKGLSLFALATGSDVYKPTMLQGVQKQQILDTLYKPLQMYEHQTNAGTMLVFPLE